MDQITKLDDSKEFDGCKSIDEYIVTQVLKENKLTEWIQEWKDYWIDKMNPIDIPDDFRNHEISKLHGVTYNN